MFLEKWQYFQLFLNTGTAQEVKIIPCRRQAPIYLNVVTDNQIQEHQQAWYLNVILEYSIFSTLRSEQNVNHFADDIIKCIFLRENICVFILISLKFIPTGPVDDKSSLVQVIDWCATGNKPLTKSMLTYCQLDLQEQNLI